MAQAPFPTSRSLEDARSRFLEDFENQAYRLNITTVQDSPNRQHTETFWEEQSIAADGSITFVPVDPRLNAYFLEFVERYADGMFTLKTGDKVTEEDIFFDIEQFEATDPAGFAELGGTTVVPSDAGVGAAEPQTADEAAAIRQNAIAARSRASFGRGSGDPSDPLVQITLPGQTIEVPADNEFGFVEIPLTKWVRASSVTDRNVWIERVFGPDGEEIGFRTTDLDTGATTPLQKVDDPSKLVDFDPAMIELGYDIPGTDRRMIVVPDPTDPRGYRYKDVPKAKEQGPPSLDEQIAAALEAGDTEKLEALRKFTQNPLNMEQYLVTLMQNGEWDTATRAVQLMGQVTQKDVFNAIASKMRTTYAVAALASTFGEQAGVNFQNSMIQTMLGGIGLAAQEGALKGAPPAIANAVIADPEGARKEAQETPIVSASTGKQPTFASEDEQPPGPDPADSRRGAQTLLDTGGQGPPQTLLDTGGQGPPQTLLDTEGAGARPGSGTISQPNFAAEDEQPSSVPPRSGSGIDPNAPNRTLDFLERFGSRLTESQITAIGRFGGDASIPTDEVLPEDDFGQFNPPGFDQQGNRVEAPAIPEGPGGSPFNTVGGSEGFRPERVGKALTGQDFAAFNPEKQFQDAQEAFGIKGRFRAPSASAFKKLSSEEQDLALDVASAANISEADFRRASAAATPGQFSANRRRPRATFAGRGI